MDITRSTNSNLDRLILIRTDFISLGLTCPEFCVLLARNRQEKTIDFITRDSVGEIARNIDIIEA